MQLQQHMSTPNVGVSVLLKRAGELAPPAGICQISGTRGRRRCQRESMVDLGPGTIPVRRGCFDPSGSHSQELEVETRAAALRNEAHDGAWRGGIKVE